MEAVSFSGSVREVLEAGEAIKGFSRVILLSDASTLPGATIALTNERLLLLTEDDGRHQMRPYPLELCRISHARTREDRSELVTIVCVNETLSLCFQKEWLPDAAPILRALAPAQKTELPAPPADAVG